MTAKEYCETHDRVGYISACNGLEIHGFDYGIEDFCYCVSNAWRGKRKYHKVKLNYTKDDIYIKIDGDRFYFKDSIREGM